MDNFFAAIQPVVAELAMAALTILGGVITKYATTHFGAKTGMLVSQAYDMAIDNGAGWLKTYLDSLSVSTDGRQMPLTPSNPAVQAAVQHVKASFPDAVQKVTAATGHPLGEGELAADILGAFGKLAPGPIGAIAGLAAKALTARELADHIR